MPTVSCVQTLCEDGELNTCMGRRLAQMQRLRMQAPVTSANLRWMWFHQWRDACTGLACVPIQWCPTAHKWRCRPEALVLRSEVHNERALAGTGQAQSNTAWNQLLCIQYGEHIVNHTDNTPASTACACATVSAHSIIIPCQAHLPCRFCKRGPPWSTC